MAENNTVQPERQVQGIKSAEYVSFDKLGADINVGDIPEGAKAYIKEKSFSIGGKRMVVRLYELINEEGGAKLRRDYLENFGNRIPDEEEIALKYGPTKPGEEGYMWIGKWKDDVGGEKGIISETIRISEKWRGRYEAHQKRLRLELNPVAEIVAPLPASSPAGAPTLMDMIALMDRGEEKAIRSMERLAAIIKNGQAETPSVVMEKAYDAAGKFMEKSLESNFRMSAATTEIVKSKMQETLDDDDDEVDETEGEDVQSVQSNPLDGLPEWTRPYISKVEGFLGTLLGGGTMGGAVKTIIQSSDDWKQIVADPLKFGEAKNAMAAYFGPEKTEAALRLLLEVKEAKVEAKAAKETVKAAKVVEKKKKK